MIMLKLVRLACLGIVLVCLLGLWGLGQQWPPRPGLEKATVCPEGPPKCDFSSIQLAVEKVASGGIVNILPGEYIENIKIWHPLTLQGEIATIIPTIIPKDLEETTVKIVSSNVTVKNLWIGGGKKGIEVGELREAVLPEVCTEVIIKGNIIVAGIGISVSVGSQADIEENLLINRIGVWVWSSPKTLIKENTIISRVAIGVGVVIIGGTVEVVNNFVDLRQVDKGIFSVAGAGIGIMESPGFLPASAVVEDNIVLGGDGGIVAIVTGELRLNRNRITESHSVGIGIQARKAEIKKNFIVGTSRGVSGEGDGMIAIASEELKLIDNTIIDNRNNGLMTGLIGSGRLQIESNMILRNGGYGLISINNPECPSLLEGAWSKGLIEKLTSEEISVELVGANNIIAENKAGDLCPPYPAPPWPEGFKK